MISNDTIVLNESVITTREDVKRQLFVGSSNTIHLSMPGLIIWASSSLYQFNRCKYIYIYIYHGGAGSIQLFHIIISTLHLDEISFKIIINLWRANSLSNNKYQVANQTLSAIMWLAPLRKICDDFRLVNKSKCSRRSGLQLRHSKVLLNQLIFWLLTTSNVCFHFK